MNCTNSSIGGGAFSGCSNLVSITLPFVGNTLNGSSNTNFSYIFGGTVPSSLTNVVIRGGGSIAASAFSGCNKLAMVTIPSSVISIGSGAFSGCSGLKYLTIPFVGNNLNGVSNTHFGYIFGTNPSYLNGNVPSSLKEVVIEGGSSIADYAFQGCKYLTEVRIPNSVTSVGHDAFVGCSNLEGIFIPDSVSSIGQCAFLGCTGLTSIIVGSQNPVYRSAGNCLIQRLGEVIIQGCNTSVIPSTVNAIGGWGAFYECSFTHITIPAGVKSIGAHAFFNCHALSSVVFSPNSQLQTIAAAAFYVCDGLERITIPASVQEIKSFAFANCSSLEEVVFEPVSQLREIEDFAFTDCNSLTEITIPESVEKIWNEAFAYCSALETVIVERYEASPVPPAA
ncbi:MAG: leucine-rich repeat domain-containing protein, partial [Firmicutes bacterium]|nr:leucine-rich repeat domain-containing protein [Bacillota bacterium]